LLDQELLDRLDVAAGRRGEAAQLSEYLNYIGIASSAPNREPDVSGLPTTTVRAYNGAETSLPLTAEALQTLFGVTVEPVTDPSVTIDFMVITGSSTPELTPPPQP